mmetsp:Transcript_36355/g.102699  ORF Transcript_36355/g.102699 Transcript_36355/m.102699 type:complete len:894 (-) Transcript_36355:276-2957(-)|eukprot:CAMPEP_0117688070 /NCGR_PEP_ID=MMETSP0804-20121206/23576_1 /TAXON_ID=1074897 /ORGANISM="Tetraselmis astigmatica, Strain CCMP880" /LENGTH=893 /DNA_ID=CAMNT_0005500383 /DNA_START=256 /DNA_END=2937 /DNA_ORIENTATION=-
MSPPLPRAVAVVMTLGLLAALAAGQSASLADPAAVDKLQDVSGAQDPRDVPGTLAEPAKQQEEETAAKAEPPEASDNGDMSRDSEWPLVGYIPRGNNANLTGILDTGACRQYSLGTLSRVANETGSWEQQTCLSQSVQFANTHGQMVDMAFLGDSNTKRWVTDAADVWKWMAERVARGSVANVGCEGMDSASGLEAAWRLASDTAISPKVWVVSLGQNDCLGDGASYEEVADRIQEIVRVIRFYNCYSQVVVTAILPTTAGSSDGSWENSPYRSCIQYTNSLLRRFAAKNSHQGVSFVDCSDKFLMARGDDVDKALMPNGLHLSYAGHTKHAACLGEHLVRFSALRYAKYSPDFDFEVAPKPSPQSKPPKYAWKYSKWSECTAACGNGFQTRKVACQDSEGKEVEDGKCSPTTMTLMRPCVSRPCPAHKYVVGPWSECSKACGTGTATRNVTCLSSRGETVPDSICSDSKAKPSSSMDCNVQICNLPCGPQDSCSGRGKCTADGKCACQPGFAGTWCQIAQSCPSGVPSKTGCCPSGITAADGTCVPAGGAVDRFGEVCASGNVDACGVCDGKADSIDIFGHCCEGKLDAAGVCCNDEDAIDECGVCSGASSSCAVTGQVLVEATSYTDLEVLLKADFKVGLSGALKNYGVTPELISVGTVTMTPGDDSAEIEFRIQPVEEPGAGGYLTASGFERTFRDEDALRAAMLLSVYSVSRAGVCGNGVCELGEQSVGDVKGSCPSDCALSFNVCPVGNANSKACSGRGLCSPATGVCDCQPGYSGLACEACQGGFELLGDRCVTYIGVFSTDSNSVTLQQDGEPEGLPFVATSLIGIVCVLAVALIGFGSYHCVFVRLLRKSEEAALSEVEKLAPVHSSDGSSSSQASSTAIPSNRF